MIDVIRETDFANLGGKKAGKVRDVYLQSDKLILVTTDRHSSFDRIVAHIPSKGQVLNQVSAWWFDKTKDIVPNHLLAVPDPNVTIAKRLTLVPVEAVMRGYLTGVTDTSIWTRYLNGQRRFGDLALPDGLKKNIKLPYPVFDPTTKEEGHDRAISTDDMVEEGIVTREMLAKMKDVATHLFMRGQEIALKRGLILVDTKYEFGTDEKGELVLIDEIHTPDSSRYWQVEGYEQSLAAGIEPRSFDKEFLRVWFKEHCDPYHDIEIPAAPEDLVVEMSRRYVRMYEQITGEKFVPGEQPALPRIEKNLKSYESR